MSHPSELRKVYEGAGTKRTKLSAQLTSPGIVRVHQKKQKAWKAWKEGRCVTSRVRVSSFVGQSEVGRRKEEGEWRKKRGGREAERRG